MKKIIIVLLFLTIYINSFSQACNLQLQDGHYSFSEVVAAEKLNPATGYNNFIENYASSLQPASQLIWAPNLKNGILSTNEESKTITLLHSFDYPGKNYRCVIYRMKIEFKENRYRYEIHDITVSYATKFSGMTNEPLEEYLKGKQKESPESTLFFINDKIGAEITRMKKKIAPSSEADKW